MNPYMVLNLPTLDARCMSSLCIAYVNINFCPLVGWADGKLVLTGKALRAAFFIRVCVQRG